jgi:hypothetical protein
MPPRFARVGASVSTERNQDIGGCQRHRFVGPTKISGSDPSLATVWTTHPGATTLGVLRPTIKLAALLPQADDWVDQRQQCIDVGCAYIRLAYQTENALPRASVRSGTQSFA